MILSYSGLLNPAKFEKMALNDRLGSDMMSLEATDLPAGRRVRLRQAYGEAGRSEGYP